MLFRIGVHLGEVIVDEEDQNIFGDGVNLAARIQGWPSRAASPCRAPCAT